MVVGWALQMRNLSDDGFLGYMVALAVTGLVGGYITRSRSIAPLGLWLGQVAALVYVPPPMWGAKSVMVTVSLSVAVLAAVIGAAGRRVAGNAT